MQHIPPPDSDLVNKELDRLHTIVRVFQGLDMPRNREIQEWAMKLIEGLHKNSMCSLIIMDKEDTTPI